MANVKFKTNRKEGQFIARMTKINNLPQGIVQLDTVASNVELMLIMNTDDGEPVLCFYDHEDFKQAFSCTQFELQAELRNWLLMLGMEDGEWIRMDILGFVPSPEETTENNS
jgi:hypothetical protein